ncbi:P450 monooxygenase AflN [Fusarium culmorum]|uniref:P450 monooxygenase AflN n=1 Tax=Fusarium culmorum TaxID=5516 RepID=A0A2T4H3N7_FUSCU|nr:P450 monooxygenase AflN [Fusarium culmorum]
MTMPRNSMPRNSMPRNSMPQLYYTEIVHRYNLEGIFYLDLWPIGPSLVIITDPKLIEQAHIPRPMVPHPFTNTFMAPIAGDDIIPTKSGTEWKKLRNDMSPTFSRAHAHSMVGVMVNEIKLLRGKLDELSATGQVFSMEGLLNKTIFGIVSRHLLNDESYAQDLADMREFIVQKRLEASLLGVIYKRLETLVSGGIFPSRQTPTSVLDLILREHAELAIRENKEGRCNFANLSKFEGKQLLTYIRGLSLGGHTTTTTILSYLFMLLSKAPHIVDKMHQEHIQQVGPNPQATLLENSDILSKLPYTEAVIKETLRLYPVGSGLKLGSPGATVYHQRRHLPIDNNLIIMTNAHGIHYNPNIYSQPTDFRPERWLSQNKAHPRLGYFRPFGGDGRWCPGQNIAMCMLKVIVVMTIRDYVFKCADLKPNLKPRTLHTDVDVVFGDIAFQQLGLEGRPRDGMMMTVRKRA